MHNKAMEFEIEALENRRLLAGNVTAVINNAGDVIVTGDNADNDVAILRFNGLNSIQVRANDDTTTINGGQPGNTEWLDISSVELRHLKINMKGGNDQVTLSTDGLDFKKGLIKLGSGNDRVNSSKTNFDNLKITLGSGIQDVATYQNNWDQTASVGFDSTIDSLVIRGSSTEDSVSISEFATVGRLNVKLSGNEDSFNAYNADFEGDFNLNLGRGEDRFNIAAAEFQSQVVINAGGDYDTQVRLAGDFAFDPIVKSVEEILMFP